MLNIAVLVSGGGTNLQAILDKISNGQLTGVCIKVVVSSKENAYAIERAKQFGVPVEVIRKKEYTDLKQFDSALIEILSKHAVDLVVLAGFMIVLGEDFIHHFSNRIINIHPSLIPAFCGDGYYGLIPHQKALEYGVKISGATVHFVDTMTDAGPIILQKAVCVLDEDTPLTLQARVMEEAEWMILPEALQLIADGKVHIEGRKVKIV